jgi:integrase
MASIRIITRSGKKGQPVSLYLRFKEGRSCDIVSIIPTKIQSDFWSNNSGSFKQRIVYDNVFTEKDKVNIDDYFNGLRKFILKGYNELVKTSAIPTQEWLASVIDKYYHKEIPTEITLNKYIANFIKEAESGDRLYDHNGITKRYEKGSIKNYKGFQAQFDKYQKDKRVKLNFDSITIDFYDEFVRYFTKKDYSINTIGRHVKNLKSIMRCAREEGLHTNTQIELKKFKVLKTKVENIYLTELELNTIKNIDFNILTPKQLEILQKNGITNINHLDLARDIFLIGCYTAQRFSDFSKIRPAHIKTMDNGLMVIDLIQQKTGERVVIPIRPELDVILKKYDYMVPKTFEQKINERIKVIGELAEITDTIIVEERKGGFKVKKDVTKNALIKTHTARRTGCTLMYLAGVPTLDIMKISGHKSEREFLNYIKVGKEETAQNLSKHPYFMGTTLKIAK